MLRSANKIKMGRVAGASMLVAGTFLFLFVVFAGMAYPIRGVCVDFASPEYGQSSCTEYDSRPEILKPIMNLGFAVSAIGIAAAGATILTVNEFKASRGQKHV